MSASDLLLMSSSSLALAADQIGMPTGSSKQAMAAALAIQGWTPARVRALSGSGPAPDGRIDSLTVAVQAIPDLRLRISAAASEADAAMHGVRNAQHLITQVHGLATGLADDLRDAAAAAAAAGAVAARAERLALDNVNRPTDQSAVTAAIRDAVRAAMMPVEAALADPAVQTRVAAAIAGPVGTDTCLNIFGVDLLDRAGRQVMVDLWGNPDAPAIDPCYIWTESVLAHLLLSQQTGENVWLGGPKGTGKSEAAKQFAARCGRAFTRINFTKHSSPEDFIGAVGLVNGQTQYVEGDLLTAYMTPGAVILLDEVSNGDPGNLAVLNPLLEPGARVNIGGVVRSKATGVMILGADNTLGNGDDSGRYSGVRLMNSSLMDRFARVLPFKYLPESVEAQAVCKHTGCSAKLALHIVRAVNVARSKVDSGDIVDAPSIRQIVAFVRALAILSVDDAWATTISSKQPAESALALDAVKAACLNNTLIEGEL